MADEVNAICAFAPQGYAERVAGLMSQTHQDGVAGSNSSKTAWRFLAAARDYRNFHPIP